nr:39S ribosomal protein L45, mitochondrial [Polyrhizophydium stewartii]
MSAISRSVLARQTGLRGPLAAAHALQRLAPARLVSPSPASAWLLSGARRFSARASSMRGRMVNAVILDRWIPPETLPAPISKANMAVLWERFKKFIFATWSVYQVRTSVKGWKPRPFALEAERMYIEMNKAFARNELAKYVSDGMMAKLNPEIKSMQRMGTFEWKAHGSERRPRVLHLATAKVQLENQENRLTQVTSMAVYNNGTLVGGNPDEHKSIVEYIVLEKWLDGKWGEGGWKIAGKITP